MHWSAAQATLQDHLCASYGHPWQVDCLCTLRPGTQLLGDKVSDPRSPDREGWGQAFLPRAPAGWQASNRKSQQDRALGAGTRMGKSLVTTPGELPCVTLCDCTQTGISGGGRKGERPGPKSGLPKGASARCPPAPGSTGCWVCLPRRSCSIDRSPGAGSLGSPASQRKDLGRSESLRVVCRPHRIFRPSDLIHGEVLGKGCFGQAIKVRASPRWGQAVSGIQGGGGELE